MSVSVVIVGINGWEEYTRELIGDIWTHEPDAEIITVDNASDTPYPQADHIYRVEERLSYAAALNFGVKRATGDWLLTLNNDIRCNGAFVEKVQAQARGAIYGRQIIQEAGHTWLGNWLALMEKTTYWKVGEWDPNYKACGFEDADYCVRAAELGIPTQPIDLPFTHLWGKTRWAIPGYEGTRLENIAYFERKHGWRPGNNMMVTHD